MAYQYLTFDQLKSALLQRLQDIGGVFTSNTEAGLYLIEALRVLNCQTAIWNIDYLLDFNAGDTWKSLNVIGSPRQRTVTDTQILTEMEYHLLEPPSGSTWTGTTQFNITNLSQALQYRRDELLLISGANSVNITSINSPIAGVTTVLPDTVLDLRRVRWIPSIDSSAGAYSLWREDIVSSQAYGDQLAINPGPPDSWMITANTPLTFDVSSTPNIPGHWDLIALESGVSLNPPTTNVLGIPDDWCWAVKYGALADALSNAPEATDTLRESYCRMRWERATKAIAALPWLLDATVASLPVDTPSFAEIDAYRQNWEYTQPLGDPQIVVGGIDMVSTAPNVTGSTVSSVLNVVGNAPIPVNGSDFIQLSRDGVDAILAYAQHIAMFKCGGKDFSNTLTLFKQFEDYCALQNRHYAALGIFRPEMVTEGTRVLDIDPIFAPDQNKGVK